MPCCMNIPYFLVLFLFLLMKRLLLFLKCLCNRISFLLSTPAYFDTILHVSYIHTYASSGFYYSCDVLQQNVPAFIYVLSFLPSSLPSDCCLPFLTDQHYASLISFGFELTDRLWLDTINLSKNQEFLGCLVSG